MVSFWRSSLSMAIVMAFLVTSIPIHVVHAMTESDRWEEIKEVMDLNAPVRKDETFAETYYRMETRLADAQKREFAELNKKLNYKIAKTKAPSAKVSADSIVLKDGSEELLIKVEKNKKGELFISVNGVAMTPEQAQSPLKTYEFLQKLPPKEKKAAAWWWHQWVPKSQALSWPLLLAGGLAIAGIGYLVYKKFFKKEKTCKDKSAVCCNQNGTLVQLENGCCTESGGLESGFTTCPTPLYIDSPTTETGTSTDSTSGTGVQ